MLTCRCGAGCAGRGMVSASGTISGQAQSFSGDCERPGDIIRQLNVVQIRIMEIEDGIAGQAVKMVVFFQVGIKAPGISLPFNDIDDLYSGKGEQGPVHRVQRNVGKIRKQLLVNGVRTRMILGLFQGFVDRNPLRGDLEPMGSAQLGEPFHIYFFVFNHFNY
jgi:hypothetical protein